MLFPNLPLRSDPVPVPGAVDVQATTSDGLQLHGLMVNGPDGLKDAAFVIAHGFTNSTDRTSTRQQISSFAQHGGVIAFDFRGHGRSQGLSSVGRDEVLDLDAAVALARDSGFARVFVVGFSMGGSVALRHAAFGAHKADAVASVSAPSRWYIRHTQPMRRVHWMLESPLGRLAGRVVGVRLGTPWETIPQSPLEAAGHVAPTPLLLVHGTDDSYFDPGQAVDLHRASAGHAELWIEGGMGHAETGTSPELADRIARWLLSRSSS